MFTLYFDGSSKCFGKNSSYGWSLERNGDEIAQGYGLIGHTACSNVSEYTALIKGLLSAFKYIGYSETLIIKGDSRVVIDQVGNRKQARLNCKHFQSLFEQVQYLLKQYEEVKFELIPREQNRRADWLANKARKVKSGKQIEDVFAKIKISPAGKGK